ncbi:ABC transporter permease [Corticicoccus populi]|uniref:Transport permease protein n=1 Tax=Corticicoccus populi TaxID=1812821 RepID=A0ABW5WXT3_9STAP
MLPHLNILKEQWENRKLIISLSMYNLKSSYAGHYLGLFWIIIMPAMQVALYYIVFGLGLRGDRGDVAGLPFIVHLISGIFPWTFISAGVNSAAGAIQSQIGLVTKMKFPSSTLITINITVGLRGLLVTTAIVLLISIINGYSNPLSYLVFFYFVIASSALIFSLGLIMSTLTIIVRDLKNVFQNVMRMCFFITPIFWSLDEADPLLQNIASFNPFAYLVMTYRTAFVLETGPFYGDMFDHIYFWTFTLFLFYIGVHIHYRFRKTIVDYL